MKTKKLSFQKALGNLLKNTVEWELSKWEEYLLVSEKEISSWIKGETLPNAEHLNRILSLLENHKDENIQKEVWNFHEMSNRPTVDVLPKKFRIQMKPFPTISDYILTTYTFPFQVELLGVNAHLKKDFMYLCTYLCRSLKSISKDKKDETIQSIKLHLQNISPLDVFMTKKESDA